MEEREAEEVVASMEEEAGSDQLAPEKCGKEKVPFINWEEIEIQEALQEDRSQHMRLICSSKKRFVRPEGKTTEPKPPRKAERQEMRSFTCSKPHFP